ncbi:helix-turn-helix domain-containing protein [Specibacter sp. NPDC057265]|uniref:helix-turn-helix domain-containing protein n=1 Tax=Specibacter sp. NPDC057265 TaxID=3346075 RepID=UPI00363915AE
MTTTILNRADVLVTEDDLNTVRHEVDSAPAGLVGFAAVMSDGTSRALPLELSKIIEKAFRALAANGSVSVGTMPDELTSNTAADVLGISRPTLLKLAKAGKLASFKVGSHTRFKREAVVAFRAQREADRHVAMDDLLALEDKLDSFA